MLDIRQDEPGRLKCLGYNGPKERNAEGRACIKSNKVEGKVRGVHQKMNEKVKRALLDPYRIRNSDPTIENTIAASRLWLMSW